MVRLQGVTKRYGKTRSTKEGNVVKNVSLDLEEGGVVVVVGSNGAGKTTLM